MSNIKILGLWPDNDQRPLNRKGSELGFFSILTVSIKFLFERDHNDHFWNIQLSLSSRPQATQSTLRKGSKVKNHLRAKIFPLSQYMWELVAETNSSEWRLVVVVVGTKWKIYISRLIPCQTKTVRKVTYIVYRWQKMSFSDWDSFESDKWHHQSKMASQKGFSAITSRVYNFFWFSLLHWIYISIVRIRLFVE
jgi:hypothetical protein